MVHVTLNRDVYAYLVTFLSSPKDLLAVCLANKEFKDLAEPEMVYRHISCRLDHTALWEHLAKNPGPASRVRKLEIQRQNPSGYGSHLVAPSREIYPNSSYLATGRRLLTDDHTPASVERAENLLVQAVRNMVNLESFIWDRWVPFINQGDDVFHSDGQDNAGSSVYSDDIWTVLRERTKIDYLKVVDLGQLNQIFSPCRPIFNSTKHLQLFTIRNLVVLDLKIYYSPDSDTFDAEDLARGRVKVERIKELLRYCPNLESLSLAILDRPFYFDFEGNPYTNITPVIAGGYWPHLTSLQLRDITVDDIAMILFLRRHPSLRKLSASLSLTEEDGPPLVPFSFESHETSIRGILPNLEYVDLPAAVLRPYLRTARRPTNLRVIQHLESGDWTTAEESVIDSDFLTSLDDVWGPGPGEDERENTNEAAASDAQQVELLAGMPKLRMLSLAYISTLKQLDKLYQLTPDLEHLVIVDPLVRYDVRLKRHEEILLYVSRWKHLVSFRGPCFWTQEMEPNDHANEVSAIACDIVAACPNLRYLSWLNGQTVKISKSETGEFLGLDIVYLPSFFGQA